MPDGVLQGHYISELASIQGKADTKELLACLIDESYGFENLKIIIVDSDIAVLFIYYQKNLTRIRSRCTFTITRYVNFFFYLQMCARHRQILFLLIL